MAENKQVELNETTEKKTNMNYSQVSRHKKVQFFLGEQAILSAPNIKLPLHLA